MNAQMNAMAAARHPENGIEVSRPLALAHAFNVRDIGHYHNREGEKLRERKFLRSDALGRLDEGDWNLLKEYGVTAIVDLRSPQEQEKEPFGEAAKQAGIRYDAVPLFDNIQSNDGTAAFPESLHKLYVQLLEGSGAQLAEVFRKFLENREGCSLFNCTAGKDRTGVIAMLLLGLAGVDEDVIVADYSVSAANMQPVFAPQIAAMKNAGYEKLAFLLESEPEDMRLTLEYVDGTYGSAEGYLKTILSEEEMEELRQMLTA